MTGRHPVCKGGAGMCGALLWGRGSEKDLGSGLAGQQWELLCQTVSRRMRAGETFSRQQEGALCDSSQGMCPSLESASGTMQRSRRLQGTQITSPGTQEVEQSTRHSAGPEPYKHGRTL